MLKTIKRIKLALKPEIITADLATLLNGLNPEHSLSERVITLGEIMDWIRLPVKNQGTQLEQPFIHSRNVRMKFLFTFLERHQELGDYLATTLQELIVPGSAVGLYCLTGISENNGFFNELSNRLVQRFLPESHLEEDLAEIFKVLFTEEEDAIWMESSLKAILPLFSDFAQKHQLTLEGLQSDRKEAMVILGAQVATLGTSKEIRRRLHGRRLTEYSFIKLNTVINTGASEETILQEISHSRLDLQTVRNNIEASGVSVDLIFKLEKIHSILDRIEMLIYLGKHYAKSVTPLIFGQFFGRLIRDDLRSLGVKLYIHENLHLLTRKIVERSGEKGHHYIATTKEDKKILFVASTWAGVLTAFTAVIKYFITTLGMPIFFEGFFVFINYALGFLALQKWHLALSSKQPAYTASALSRKFEAFKKSRVLSDVSVEIRKIMSSQFLTTIGNLLWVVPTAVAIDWAWFFLTKNHIVSVAEAHKVINKHNIFTSLTIPYAILTGVLLWLSSVIAGWVENWLVFRDIPEAMRVNQFMKKLFRKEQLNYMATHFAGTMGLIAGNISIAFFMAAPMIISKFTGLPLDIRHVTLAAGTVTLALNTLEWNVFEIWDSILIMILSITVIGTLNFSVSFFCALRMAALARNVESKYLKIIFRYALFKRPDSEEPAAKVS